MDYTDVQYLAIEALGRDIAIRWPGIEWDNTHVIGHFQAGPTDKWDPAQNFKWEEIGLPGHEIVSLDRVPADAGYAIV